jgi:hypothetical protein
MVLVPPSGDLPAASQSYLRGTAARITQIFAYGGGYALHDDVVAEVKQALS